MHDSRDSRKQARQDEHDIGEGEGALSDISAPRDPEFTAEASRDRTLRLAEELMAADDPYKQELGRIVKEGAEKSYEDYQARIAEIRAGHDNPITSHMLEGMNLFYGQQVRPDKQNPKE